MGMNAELVVDAQLELIHSCILTVLRWAANLHCRVPLKISLGKWDRELDPSLDFFYFKCITDCSVKFD